MDIVHYVKSDNYTMIRVLEVLRLACEMNNIRDRAMEIVNHELIYA